MKIPILYLNQLFKKYSGNIAGGVGRSKTRGEGGYSERENLRL